MKKIFFILSLAITSGTIYCQNSIKSLDFILVIDENIAIGSITSLQLEVIGDTENIVHANYFPGSLSMNVVDYAKLLSETTKAIYLKFTYFEYHNKKQEVYNYEIEIKKAWLSDYYNILRIYNLDKLKYRGKLDPIGKGKNYNYELDSPSHSFRLIWKKK